MQCFEQLQAILRLVEHIDKDMILCLTAWSWFHEASPLSLFYRKRAGIATSKIGAIIAQRDRCIRDATVAGNRINNTLTRFGFTLGRNGSVVKDKAIRSVVEDQISDNPSKIEGLCPVPIPMEVRTVLREEYEKYDHFTAQAAEYKEKIFEKARSMEWETDTGILPGDEMIRILSTAPQVGELTAVIWLARVITPRRFHNANALSAYCGFDPSLKISAGKVTSMSIRRRSRISLKCAAILHAKRLAVEGAHTLSLTNEISDHCALPFVILSDTIALYNDRMVLSIVKKAQPLTCSP